MPLYLLYIIDMHDSLSPTHIMVSIRSVRISDKLLNLRYANVLPCLENDTLALLLLLHPLNHQCLLNSAIGVYTRSLLLIGFSFLICTHTVLQCYILPLPKPTESFLFFRKVNSYDYHMC